MNRALIAFACGTALLCASLAGQEPPKPDADPVQLALILRSAREYCARLERAALDFVCLEEVGEKLDLSRDDREAIEQAGAGRIKDVPAGELAVRPWLEVRRHPKQENSYLYDYQFIRRDGKIEEKRVLIERNGKKTDLPVPSARFSAFSYSDVLLAPVRLLDREFEGYYSYSLLGREALSGVDAWVLEIKPRMAGTSLYLGGKLWIGCDDSSVLRIEWDPTTFGHFERIQARAESYAATPEVRSYTEFAVEKNGLRFPSADFTEEAYRSERGKLFVRARTSVTYRDHKFFTVETSSTFKK